MIWKPETQLNSIALNQHLVSIHPDAKIGNNVTIEPFAVIKGDVVIGDDCFIGSHAIIENGARLGKGVRIFPGAVVAGIPQDLKFNGEYSTVEVGDYATIREYATVNRGTVDKYKTVIGKHTLIMAKVHVAHDCIIGDHVVIANAVSIAGHVEIGDHVGIGGMTAIHQFVKVGKYSFVSGGSLIRKDVPPFTKAGREPLSFVGVNSVGLRRREFETETIENIKDIYRTIYQSGLNNTQAMDKVAEIYPASRERDEILSFIQSSERGIIRGFAQETKEFESTHNPKNLFD